MEKVEKTQEQSSARAVETGRNGAGMVVTGAREGEVNSGARTLRHDPIVKRQPRRHTAAWPLVVTPGGLAVCRAAAWNLLRHRLNPQHAARP